MTVDIQQMFHCFTVKEDHRDCLRFIWFRENDLDKDVIEGRMKVHVFGNSPSPTVAIYGLCRAAKEIIKIMKIMSKSPVVLAAFPSEDCAEGVKDLDLEDVTIPAQRSLGLSWKI